MDVLILHYHLNPGGVTRIVESQVKSISFNNNILPVKVLCGISSGLPMLSNIQIVQDRLMNYVSADISDENLVQNQAEIISLIRSHLTRHTIIHSHNPNLGKNPALTAALYKIAGEGVPVINHYHDFAEDRPANMEFLGRVLPLLTSETAERVIYPALSNYHYIVLNSCDVQRLTDKGINHRQIRFLPNPVPEWGSNLERSQDLREKVCSALGFSASDFLCTYPVRAIQRKNIGEFLLMAVLFAEAANFAITLAPLNPVEIPGYERWKSFCNKNSINVRFEASDRVSFKELIAASDFCITTSIREGFGMVYMEPWLAGTPVIGREISCVIGDLQHSGLRFPRLYEKLEVQTGQGKKDFKDISVDEQENVILNALKDRGIKKEIFQANTFLDTWLNRVPDDLILNNQKIIRQKFSLEEYGKQLLGFYSEISR